MDRRTSTMPMDYEWENKTGQFDPTSPFMNVPRNTMNNTAKKRNHNSVIEPPAKFGQQNPNLPHLRDPANQNYYFSRTNPPSPPKPLPSLPAHVQSSSTWALRTPKRDIDYSSGGDTPNTPDVGADSEATPDTSLRGKMSRLNSGDGRDGKSSPSKPRRRESLFGSLGNMFSLSPKASQSAKPDHYSRAGEKRIQKRRERGVNRGYVRQAMESDSDSDDRRVRRRREKASKKDRRDRDREEQDSTPPETQPALPQGSTVASIFSFIEQHPGLPHILSYYAQLLLNFFISFSAIYLIWSFWSSITHEVDIQSQRSITEMILENAKCAKDWEDNGCGSARPPPSLKDVCANWEGCMKRDAKKVARASVSAKTFAMIFNSFVEEIGYKAMLFAALLIIGSFVVSNYAFASYRAHRAAPPPYDRYMHPPATPQRYPSGGFIDHQGYFTPYTTFRPAQSQQQLGIEPAPSGEADLGIKAEQGSPSKMRVYR